MTLVINHNFSGCDVTRNAYYCYNGDAYDEGTSGYGSYPPAEGVVFLKGPLADANDGIDNNRNCITDETNESCLLGSARDYWADSSIVGVPIITEDYYNYMQGNWKDSTVMEYGGNGWAPSGTTNGVVCKYKFPRDSDSLYGWGQNGNCTTPNVQSPWDEASSNNLPNDRRMFGSTGPFIFMPGETKTIDLAYVYARDSISSLSYGSIYALGAAIDEVQYFFDNLMNPDCSIAAYVKEKEMSNGLVVYPNPVSSVLNLEVNELNIKVISLFDITGKCVKHIDVTGDYNTLINVEDLANGLYIIEAINDAQVFTLKFVKE